VFWFWFFVGPALVLAFLSLRGERKRAAYVAEKLAQPAEFMPPATVIVPVKGEDEGLKENLGSLASLDYPDYELLIAAHCAADIPPHVLPSRAKVVLAHGDDPHSGEKVQNLLAAVRSARKKSEILAFADSDGRVLRGWLRALSDPLAKAQVGAATGYRWYLPEPPTFWSLVRSVWNAPIAGLFGPGQSPFAWGGAMAIRKETFFSSRVPDFWQNSVSDDYGLTAAVRRAGLSIVFAPGAMVAARDHISMREFFRWTRRQMIISRVYNPRLWWAAFIAHVFYCGSMAACIAAIAQGSRGAEWALIALLTPALLKGANRGTLAKLEFPLFKEWFDRYGWVHTWWVPLTTWVWLISLAASAWTNVIEWRGNRYEISAQGVERLKPRRNKQV